MKGAWSAALSGLLFGIGLSVSGMINPAKVLGFLDILGAWDPTLAFVMGGALIPMALAWAWTRRSGGTLTGAAFPSLPPDRPDGRLVAGAVLFGLGWGMVGLCPGPALSGLVFGGVSLWIFVVAMAAGMVIFGVVQTRLGGSAR